MTKADLVEQIASATGLTRVETDAVVSGVVTLIAGELAKGGRVELRGLGVFDVVARAAETRRAIAFRPSQPLREAVEGLDA